MAFVFPNEENKSAMATMKVVRMHAFGDVDVLHYEEVERPVPQAGEVLVRVRAAGVNPVDWGERLPYILGWDLAGDVVALGAGVTQLAKWKGAQVIATTSTRDVAFVRELGADLVIDYTRASVADVVQEVDVVLDMMGEDVLRQAFEVVKRGGWVISLLRAHRELGEQLAAQAGVRCEFILVHPSGERLAEIARLCDADQLNVHIYAVFQLQDVAQAHKLSESRNVRGNLVLTVV